jgi:hypothetical protein
MARPLGSFPPRAALSRILASLSWEAASASDLARPADDRMLGVAVGTSLMSMKNHDSRFSDREY